jgi:hypothetical protein
VSSTAQKQNTTKFLAQTTARVAHSLLLRKCSQTRVTKPSSKTEEPSTNTESDNTTYNGVVINITKRQHPHLIINIQEQEAIKTWVIYPKGNSTPWLHELPIHSLVLDSLIEFEKEHLSEFKVYKDLTLHFRGGNTIV